MKYLFDNYKIQLLAQVHDERILEVPSHLTREDANIIVAELRMLFG